MSPTVLQHPSSTCYTSYKQDNNNDHCQPNDFLACRLFPDYVYQQPLYCAPFDYLQPQYRQHFSRTMALSHPTDMEDFQRLSDEYRADLPGPLIGEKLDMSVLATEYAQADPTYVVKTTMLAQTYSAYRTVKGDGQCGWRGTVFGYFETLLHLNDIEIVQQERVRLQSFEDTMKMAGIDYDIIIDMFDYTWELFDALYTAVENRNENEHVILDSLNDSVKSDSIIYHFKMMTSAYMQLHADQYEPFLEMPIADYRVTRIDPANQEIDQIGLQALTDAVIAPANIALEVLYLDRSFGEEVTPHPFVADAIGKQTIHLLYRPGHYDLIYKGPSTSAQIFFQKGVGTLQALDMTEPSAISSDLQAYLFPAPQGGQYFNQESQTSHRNVDKNNYARFGQENNPQYFLSTYTYPTQTPLTLSTQVPDSKMYAPMHFFKPDVQSPISPINYSPTASSDIASSPHSVSPVLSGRLIPTRSPTRKSIGEPQIRLNANCFNYGLKHESVPLCAQGHGSAAALSTAHFRNQEFQPQIWRAEEEYLKP